MNKVTTEVDVPMLDGDARYLLRAGVYSVTSLSV